MNIETYEKIKKEIENYQYTSMLYTDYEEAADCEIISWNEELILLYGFDSEKKVMEYHWAANQVDVLVQELEKKREKAIITFVPVEWVEELERIEYHINAVWNDYFNPTLEGILEPEEPFQFLSIEECREASDVTLACRRMSRGFEGESEEWMKKWITGTEAHQIMQENKDAAVLIHKEDNKIVGIVCVSTYAHDSEKGPILWVREIAVHPKYQRQGIAHKLLLQALYYGKVHGANRAFLSADECNEHAIHLYNKVGFQARKEEAQRDMVFDAKI
ncbi:GNAT family N-acetyltransferase [Anaeromicropila herbilytica]|uniref:N-acetyltransferase domain-containing protein n=1 Tax=Anaeromicropila herbilytica TaxID=2785025 RepID=A0A7R7ICG0_9FIRM|nr:GNAT family N-acetyltransferase [Anaeromicropila herbilytica]BCN29826.1 hypothetical protein bsdtb5_11210 [Anaeromicropila herbilytica]